MEMLYMVYWMLNEAISLYKFAYEYVFDNQPYYNL